MLRVFCNSLLRTKAVDSTSRLVFIGTISSSAESNSGPLDSIDDKTLTISYLAHSCGLPLKTATSIAEEIRILTVERPDSVIELLRANGFTNTHIANLLKKNPRLLLADPVKTLKPKFDFFKSLGFTKPDLANFVSSNRFILLRSLQKKIIPTFDFFKTFIHTNENLVSALKQCSSIVDCNIKKNLEPNIATLRSYGVPDSNISKMILIHSKPLTLSASRFKDVAAMVHEMGLNPNRRSFILAICSISAMSKHKWEKKREVCMSFGWSEIEFLSAFKVQPALMLTSEEKLRKLMDFFLNVLHLKPSDVAKCPNLFMLSLERRIIPRCSVLQVLMSKGLVKKNLYVIPVLNCSKPIFEKRYVTKYEQKAPEVIKAYEGELGFVGFHC